MTDESSAADQVREEPEGISLSDFLESLPPNQVTVIPDLARSVFRKELGHMADEMQLPDLQLHCSNEACNGTRFFRCVTKPAPVLSDGGYRFFYLTYRCSNCQDTQKTFALGAKVHEAESSDGECYKFGELPTYGPPTPARLIKLIGPDREIFLKGRRCENQGLGIGAFIYYRRVVENQKNRILGEILQVSEKIGVEQKILDTLREAISETQFSKALSMVRDAIPQALLINGHNPMLLLHGALSDGVHGRSDEECLEVASSVRVVLGELAERLSQALKDEVELSKALSTLMGRKNG